MLVLLIIAATLTGAFTFRNLTVGLLIFGLPGLAGVLGLLATAYAMYGTSALIAIPIVAAGSTVLGATALAAEYSR